MMRRIRRTIVWSVCVTCLGAASWAQDEAEYPNWMKTVSATASSLGKNLEAKSGDAAAADAQKLQEVFGQVKAFWEKRNVSDATQFATNAQSGFHEIGQLAAGGKFEEASAALTKVRENCAGCHNAHRERQTDGTFKIK
ncbi:MAG: hypothetical protein HY313_05535 [Acidobacteria bacterium]|nr:hypothetical protein [Acidobacteriota bacterium]